MGQFGTDDQPRAVDAAEWIKAVPLADLKRLKRARVQVGDRPVALFYVKGEVFGFDDVCIHKHVSLTGANVFDGCIVCAGHQWAFDLKTGWNDTWSRGQPVYDTRIVDGDVYVAARPRVYTEAPPAAARYHKA